MSDFLPYGRQEITDEDVAAVAAALRQPLITQGPLVAEFEQSVADAVEARHVVAFANGTAALHAAAAAAGLGPGDEVLTTPISFVASSNCALFVGARPRFADIDPLTGNLDAQAAVDSGIPDSVRACVAVSLSGLPVDLAPLQKARAAGLTIIEDGCHALGGRRSGSAVGSGLVADMTAFSLHPVKSITTGEGGLISTDRDDLADALREFRTHGIRRSEPTGDALPGPWHYDVATLGFNYRITDFQCALGLSQMRRLESFVAGRNRVAARYREQLAGVDGVALPAEPGDGDLHGYHLFVVRFPEGAARRRTVADGLRAAGIGTQLHYIPIYRHGLYRELGYGDDGARLPEAERYYREALSLPMFPAMTDGDVDRVVRELRRLLAVAVLPEPAEITS